MKGAERVSNSVFAAGILSAGLYFLLDAGFANTCESSFSQMYSIDFSATASLLSVAFFGTIFPILYALAGRAENGIPRSTKMLFLGTLTWALLWFAYVFANGVWCSESAWRNHATILILPIFANLLFAGRQWLNNND